MSVGKIIALSARAYRTLLRRAPRNNLVGGRTYDAIIVECARRAQGATLLTFNLRHFMPLAERGVKIAVPGQ